MARFSNLRLFDGRSAAIVNSNNVLQAYDASNLTNLPNISIVTQFPTTNKLTKTLYVNSETQEVKITDVNGNYINVSLDTSDIITSSNANSSTLIPTINAVTNYIDSKNFITSEDIDVINSISVGNTQIKGDVTLVAGNNISLSTNNNTITITSTAQSQLIQVVDAFSSETGTANRFYVNRNTKQSRVTDDNGAFIPVSMNIVDNVGNATNSNVLTGKATFDYINLSNVKKLIYLEQGSVGTIVLSNDVNGVYKYSSILNTSTLNFNYSSSDYDENYVRQFELVVTTNSNIDSISFSDTISNINIPNTLILINSSTTQHVFKVKQISSTKCIMMYLYSYAIG